MLKLGTNVVDKTTKQYGMLTHMQVEENGNVYYNFQPRGLHPKTGEPLDCRWLVDTHVLEGVEITPPSIPTDILGSIATDLASGYTGTAVSLRLHLNGCVHVSLQSDIILEETGNVPNSIDFDIRRLVGDKIKTLTDSEHEASIATNPSPAKVMKSPIRMVMKNSARNI